MSEAMARTFVVAALMATSCNEAEMNSKGCDIVNPLDREATNTEESLKNPIGDARTLFEQNRSYNLVVSQHDGMWDIEFENDDILTNDVSGKSEFRDSQLGIQMSLAASDSGRKFPLRVISILLQDRRLDLGSLVGKPAESASSCYRQPDVESYIRAFNRESLRLVANELSKTQK